VHEDLPHVDAEREPRRPRAARGQVLQQLVVADQRRAPVDPQRLVHPRDEEDQTHVRVLEHVGV
jgi:hypothetical protein